MESHAKWKAKVSFACYLALIGGILLSSLVVALVLLSMGIIHVEDLPFPVSLISLPVSETLIVVITLLFARYKGVSLKELGLRKPSIKILMVVSAVALPLFLLGVGISAGEEMVFGPDPTAETVEEAVMPRDPFQLVAILPFLWFWLDPARSWLSEVLFRGVLRTRLGRGQGLLVSSVLFGLLHGLNTLYAVVPVFVVGLVLGTCGSGPAETPLLRL